MVIPPAVFLLATAAVALPARGDAVSMTVLNFGLARNWADDCSGRHGVRLNVVAPPAAGLSGYRSLTTDGRVKTTLRSVSSRSACCPRDDLRMHCWRPCEQDGDPLPSRATNAFDKTFEKLAVGGLRMIGSPPIPLKGYHD